MVPIDGNILLSQQHQLATFVEPIVVQYLGIH